MFGYVIIWTLGECLFSGRPVNTSEGKTTFTTHPVQICLV
ncbi:rCG54979 [Rattus norvegicus]|uniref:RCG54979 n=1 Tax=Rattus norvegicus TaxID=10116 RepID=A6IIB7_RAT|nr:rCG54979 [Rattus norvegicus]